MGFRQRAGFYAGLCIATCIGLFLFTRIQIPDVMLTATIALAMWAFLRALDEDEPHPRLWAAVMAAAMATGLLLKRADRAGVSGGGGAAFICSSRGSCFASATWQRCIRSAGSLIVAADRRALARAGHAAQSAVFRFHACTASPATTTASSGSIFINEHVLRFLNLRYPRDYNTVPRL